jgi:hypothetical protein
MIIFHSLLLFSFPPDRLTLILNSIVAVDLFWIADFVFNMHVQCSPPPRLQFTHTGTQPQVVRWQLNGWLILASIISYNFMIRKVHWCSLSSDGSNGLLEKINTELELILHKKHMILHLLQNASKRKDSLPIPLHLHR